MLRLFFGEDLLARFCLPRFMSGASMASELNTWQCLAGRWLKLRARAGGHRGRLGGETGRSMREWKPETAAEARERITEVIELADHDILDVARSRGAEQEVTR